jgi:mRNA interferase RelE/StbE
MKEVVYTTSAIRQLRKLPGATRERLLAKLRRYAETGAGDVTALTAAAGSRLRVGDYRIIFVETPASISVRAVGHRRQIYDF